MTLLLLVALSQIYSEVEKKQSRKMQKGIRNLVTGRAMAHAVKPLPHKYEDHAPRKKCQAWWFPLAIPIRVRWEVEKG